MDLEGAAAEESKIMAPSAKKKKTVRNRGTTQQSVGPGDYVDGSDDEALQMALKLANEEDERAGGETPEASEIFLVSKDMAAALGDSDPGDDTAAGF